MLDSNNIRTFAFMMNQKGQIVKEKAEKVIKRCENCHQLKVAFRYVDLIYNKFSDAMMYTELYELAVKKEIELNCGYTFTD